MSTTSPSLKNFIELVPLCLQTAALSSLQSIFSQGNCDRIAVVNEQLQPLGLVYLSRFWVWAIDRTNDWEQPLSASSLPIEPIRVIPGTLSVSEFWEYLQIEELNTPAESGLSAGGGSKSPIGLTDASGKFLGMLECQSLLQFAAVNSSLRPEATAVKEIELTTVSAAIATALGSQVRFLEAGLKPSENLNSLVQLLEKLPLPLRLQTPTGQIVSQNAAWRILLGAGPDPVPEPTANLGKHSPHKPSHVATEYKSVEVDAVTSECRSLVGASRSGEGLRDSFAARDGTAATSCPLPLYAAASPSTLTAPAWCPTAGKPDTYICDCPVQTGQERIWQFVKQPLSNQLILVMGQDVTEEHLVAKELAAKNADLIHLNRLKDEFLSCISHELKTPLTAVLGLSSLLKDKLIGELNDRQTRYAKLIHQSGRHLMTIVNDILDLTRMETGQLELIPEPVEIAATCKRAFEQAKQLQQQEEKSPSQPSQTKGEASQEEPPVKIEFTLEIEPGLSYLIADELRLRQMLVNLLSNALKFTEAGGKIGLKVNVWEGWLAFTVWDTGIGIPADKQHLIFQKFQQLESPLTRRFQGTGLGLVLTQRLARLHGGDVSFISSENQGSEFTLLLPPNPPGNSGEEFPAHTGNEEELFKPKYQIPIANSRSRLVLIVEAVPKYIEDLSKVLSGLGYQVIVARSGTEALEKARRFSPEAIFLNPLLPLLSGWDVLTLLKSDPDTRSIPAIVTATRGEKERASVNRAEGFLSLPVEEAALRRLLADSIGRPDASTSKVRSSLTVLWLSPQNSSSQGSALLLNPNYCRVLEADDLGQAELVARIWRPDAIVLDSTSQLQNPLAFIEQLSLSRNLGSLPLVTLDPVTTQLANQVKGLSVFPCLSGGSPEGSETSGTGLGASALWQVIQVAAGMSWKPSILFADILTLPDLHCTTRGNPTGELAKGDRSTKAEIPVPHAKFSTPNFQALIQYIQTAGFRGAIAPCWTEVLQQLQYQSVDLVLLCLRDTPSESSAMLQALSNLRQMAVKLPILVWDDRSAVNSESEAIDFLLQEVSAKILPSSLSAAQLLDKIQQTLLTK
ncbi:MAG: hybrid sensor histidine kinase/response regulator [Microcoleus sp. PH2017_25_DOB_D_A]|uniref:ATP-binding response regulator n=1 Tax=unclassified Microcoleus TaxID=2642155 RepID=UPI001D6783B8|nr:MULTISPECIES: hybrid sensor histidine kinase/response regulator [unclassified Microcoleus]MCC3536185.1 hybrid sensor histidine kinase/response regulator [Microcoleus sp. PH2017_25_DOB_D_A]MCC3547977.1 hybrid sensor histidine kinase/response regulator [Microcoleus sp. PH2017_24_DOB_U_A]TAE42879.1 MAG: response regulator [Oscillatoriales cyanobacterium]